MLFQLVRTAASRAQHAAFLAVNPSVASTSAVRQSSPATTSTRVFSSLYDSEELLESGYKRPGVQWYPGHIAKAERQLAETLKAVDVVVEVRDARACKATAHPRVGEWCAGSPRIVVLTHLDMIPKSAANAWRRAYEALGAERWDEAPINAQVANQAQQAREVRFQYNTGAIPDAKNPKSSTKTNDKPNEAISPVEQVLFVNARQGEGIHALHRAIFKAGAHVQERRERRGLNARALRVGIIGYPNVGKVSNTLVAQERKKPAALHHTTFF
jgi:ribosome biogenesis GTPase A